MQNKLLVVTDLGRLKAYRVELSPKHPPRLELLEEVVFEESRQHLRDLVTDLAGRHVSPTQKNWGAPVGDDHNLKLEITRRLIRRIVKHIEKLIQSNGHDGCWLAAHKEIDHQILEELPDAIRHRIEKNLPRDLTKADPKELVERFLEIPSMAVHT